MRYFRNQLQAAGLANWSPLSVIWATALFSGLISLAVHSAFSVWGLTVSSFLAVFASALETLKLRARLRSDALAKIWPELIDSLHSATTSGMSLMDSLSEIAKRGPIRVRSTFGRFVELVEAGEPFYSALDWLKAQFGSRSADSVLELIRVVHEGGSQNYSQTLRRFARQLREDTALWGELESKQGWVMGTAKLALIAPWIVVATLSVRGENVAVYNSVDGLSILLLGLIASVLAHRMIVMLGELPKPDRVFDK